jgi:hypothetical protein
MRTSQPLGGSALLLGHRSPTSRSMHAGQIASDLIDNAVKGRFTWPF